LKKTCCLIFIMLMTSCSANQIILQSQFVPSDASLLFKLQENVTVKAANARPSILNAGTHWMQVGFIDQGNVYKAKDQIVIVNSFNVHEGYIVVNDSVVVGYYLPVENTFIESKPTQINIQKLELSNEY